ncbi:hypothetical protein EVG20_g819 [Dentipellis fragilis]|uniref:Uncharacterized protein n=1 Tax=Dentipellis fragilis TaxID=205917 RepID=A0A4Y9ZEB9_9AGAM|nr:hypothetical protein EVG20_g819 [Dentipellis fragilis]
MCWNCPSAGAVAVDGPRATAARPPKRRNAHIPLPRVLHIRLAAYSNTVVSPASMFSSLFSHVFTTRILYPRMMKQLAQNVSKSGTSPLTGTGIPRVPQISVPSFSGSMGVVFAGCTMMALMLPDVPISLPFLSAPSVPFAYGVGGVILFDCIGALRGWR